MANTNYVTNPGNMENKSNLWMAIMVIGFVMIAGFWYMSQDQNTMTEEPMASGSAAPNVMSSGSPSSSPELFVEKNLVSITKNTFVPGSISVKVGDTVTWVNDDTDLHTVSSNDKVFTSPSLAEGEKYSYTFTKEGTFKYVCSKHPDMMGSVVVSK